ncbi:MAG: hypothetical protein LQ338_002502 [Usnochroma carphineum]|nr:MAG: hypothetical protein LQ338_002502 [Usnochroma carphineum]
MWEVDPETKTKLLALQKLPGNTTCCDCSAPSPQWASPKFGTFICLACAGLHRGLGVHISFVRSITMDAFKGNEILRMEKGGNERWKGFWSQKTGREWGCLKGELRAFEEVYGGLVGEEWRGRLGCEVEGREFEGVMERGEGVARGDMQAQTQKEMNEGFFARKGEVNKGRREDVPPSQGGKYAGFGSEPVRVGGGGKDGGGGMPGVDEFQKDPVAALTKGFGWFTTTVGKGAKSVNDGWVKPGVQKLAEADLAIQARSTAAQVAHNIQAGSKNAAEQFHRFVEDSGAGAGTGKPSSLLPSSSRKAAEPEHKDFWDSFGSPVADDRPDNKPARGGVGGMSGRNSPIKQQQGRASPAPAAKANAIGTAAMRKGGKEKEEDKWEDF